MSELGERISDLRREQKLSQESLAEKAKVSLRTLQRIEKENTNPQGDTLHRLAAGLGVPLDELLNYALIEDFNYIRYMHFSVLIVGFLPLGNIILPTIFWLSKRNKIKYLSSYGRRLLNFQITWTILLFFPVFLIVLIMRSLQLNLHIAVYYLIIMLAINYIYTFIVGLLITKGDRNYYPIAIPFILR